MCYKLSQLSYYVCSCQGIAVHENNYRRQKQFHTILSKNTLHIIPVILVKLAKSGDCDFSLLSLPFKRFQSAVNTNLIKSLAPYFARWCARTKEAEKFYPRIIDGFRDI